MQIKIINFPPFFRLIAIFIKPNLIFENVDLLFKYDNKRMPVSSCSRNCEQGQMKKYANDDKCCWKCIPCAKYEVN